MGHQNGPPLMSERTVVAKVPWYLVLRYQPLIFPWHAWWTGRGQMCTYIYKYQSDNIYVCTLVYTTDLPMYIIQWLCTHIHAKHGSCGTREVRLHELIRSDHRNQPIHHIVSMDTIRQMQFVETFSIWYKQFQRVAIYCKQLQTVSTCCKQFQSVANSFKQLQSVANFQIVCLKRLTIWRFGQNLINNKTSVGLTTLKQNLWRHRSTRTYDSYAWWIHSCTDPQRKTDTPAKFRFCAGGGRCGRTVRWSGPTATRDCPTGIILQFFF